MPGKKKAPAEQKPLLGRPGNTLRMGIVGLPNVGKSSTFNLLANLTVPAENYPFCTIDPHEARVPIPDSRFEALCKMYSPPSQVPAALIIKDIAGLVPGASEGAGLGNAFLSHISSVDGIFHVVRAFDDADVVHTEGDVNATRDLDIIHRELCLKDLEHCNNRLEDVKKTMLRGKNKELEYELDCLTRAQEALNNTVMIKDGDWNNKDIEVLNRQLFLTAKPIVYLVNLSSRDYIRKKNRWLPQIQNWVMAHGGGPIIPYSIEFELNLVGMAPEEKSKFLEEEKATCMIPRIIRTGYSALQLVYFFTVGADEVRCWTIRQGTKAPQAAGVIHSDFERGFICAEIMKYDDLMRCGNENAVKAEGKYRQHGKEYVVEDGDIIYFKFNVTNAPKK